MTCSELEDEQPLKSQRIVVHGFDPTVQIESVDLVVIGRSATKAFVDYVTLDGLAPVSSQQWGHTVSCPVPSVVLYIAGREVGGNQRIWLHDVTLADWINHLRGRPRLWTILSQACTSCMEVCV